MSPDNKIPVDTTPIEAHPTKTTKIINFAIVGALLAIALSLFVILKWSVADTEVLKIKNNPFPARVVNDPTGKTGGIVFLKIDYCKDQNLKGSVRTSYVSKSREVFLPVAKEQIPVGCGNQELPVIIPLGLLKDTYKIKFHVVYDINPLKQNIVMDFESQPFDVGEQMIAQ